VTPADADHLRSIETARLTALVNADMDLAEQLHAVDYQLITPRGVALTRTEYLHAVATQELDYCLFEPISPIDVWGDGQIALLRYRARIGFHRSSTTSIVCWHTDCYRRNGGNWQAVWSQATEIAVN
jgi:hypothetical protein